MLSSIGSPMAVLARMRFDDSRPAGFVVMISGRDARQEQPGRGIPFLGFIGRLPPKFRLCGGLAGLMLG
jgi:hypothetical protein